MYDNRGNFDPGRKTPKPAGGIYEDIKGTMRLMDKYREASAMNEIVTLMRARRTCRLRTAD
jgi:hypothetical protein